MRKGQTASIQRFVVGVLLTVCGVIALLPLIWMVISGFKTNQEIFSDPFGLPASFDLERWARAWQAGNIGRYTLNSLFVTSTSVACVLLFSIPAAYAFSRFTFRFKNVIFALFLIGLVLPVQAYFIAQSNLFKQLSIINTHLALIIPYVAASLSVAIFLLRSFLQALPKELFDAARIDGASDLRLLVSIVVPLIRPGIITVGILEALSAWNEFLLVLLYIQDPNLRTIPTGLLAFQSRYSADYGMIFAGLTIVTVPMVIIYAVLNRQITHSLVAGSVK